MNPGLRALCTRRLLIVTGKGGTGKTTLAAALGLLAARQGIDTAVIEVSSPPELPRRFHHYPERLGEEEGRTPIEVAPHLYTMQIIPEIALMEYMELQLHFRPLARRIIRNPGFRRLLDAAPGWRALITLGKLWHLQSRTRRGRPLWPLLVVDAPSTGHGLSFLSVPNVVLDTVRLGPLRTHTEEVQRLLEDPSRTRVLPVTLPEELPVTETLELSRRVRDLGMALGPLTANAIEPAPAIPHLDKSLEQIARSRPASAKPGLRDPELIRSCIQHRTRRAAMQQGFLEKLEQETGADLLRLPYLDCGVETLEGLSLLADRLEEQLEEWRPGA